MKGTQLKPRRLAIPQSNACVQVMTSGQIAEFLEEGLSVQVRCRSCEHRLFDVTHGRSRSIGPKCGTEPRDSLVIEKICPSCKRKNRGSVTIAPGDPLQGGLEGPWRCECRKSLGYVDPIRGRIRTTCRCSQEVRVTASEAIRLANDIVPTVPVSDTIDGTDSHDLPF